MRQTTSAFTAFVSVLALGTAIGALPAAAQEVSEANGNGARVFLDSCAACHTIGGGELAGPDLAGSEEMDRATLRSEVERMQDYAGPLDERQIGLLVDLLADPAAAERLEQARSAAASEDAATTEVEEQGSPERGAALFFGERRLAAGGLACAACHRAGAQGGTFAADLSGAAERIGRSGLITAAERAAFPVMQAAYRDHPVSHDEAVDLTAFLAGLSAEPDAPGPAGGERAGAIGAVAADFPVGGWAVGVAGAGFIVIMLLYRRRSQRGGGVRKRLIRRAHGARTG